MFSNGESATMHQKSFIETQKNEINIGVKKGEFKTLGRLRWHLYQPHLGTQVHRCGCFLPDLTRLTVYRCEGTSRDTIKEAC
jgi:hypothetical protein